MRSKLSYGKLAKRAFHVSIMLLAACALFAVMSALQSAIYVPQCNNEWATGRIATPMCLKIYTSQERIMQAMYALALLASLLGVLTWLARRTGDAFCSRQPTTASEE